MLNKAFIARKFKRALIFLKLDNAVANLHARFPYKMLFKAIPSWDYYLGSQTKRVRRYGVNFIIYPADFSQWTIFSAHIDSHLFVAKRLIKPGHNGLILDVGANCGIFGLVIAKYFSDLQSMQTVSCYEPNPRVFELLTKNLKQNPELSTKVNLYMKGLGNEAGLVEMQIPLRNSGAGSILRNYESEPHDQVTFEISTVDIELANCNQRVDFIKIDVENYEYFVLDGAKSIIQRDRPVIYFEVGPGQIQQIEMFHLLDSLNYRFFQIRDEKFVEFFANAETFPWFTKLDNIAAIHKEIVQFEHLN